MKNWFTIQSKHAGVIDISIHDEIGMWGISAADFIAELRGQPESQVVNLSIHSPGGSVLDGLAMYNALKGYPAKIYGHVEGVAASAASFVLMAADVISMPEDSFIMIHNPWGGAIGDADELRDMATVLATLQNSLVNIYERRTGLDREAIEGMMKVETWITATDALEMGFTDNISDAVDIAAKLVGFERYFKQLPVAADTDLMQIDKVSNIKDYGKVLRDAGGFSRKAADALVARGKVVLLGDPGDDGSENGKKLSEALDKVTVPTGLI